MKKLFLVTFLIIFSTTLLYSQPRRGNQEKKMQPQNAWICDQLNLDEAQKDKIQELRYNHQLAAIDKRTELKKNQLALKNIMRNKDLNRQEYLDLVSKGSKIQAELKMMKAEMMLNIRGLLTEDQLENWQTCRNFGGRKGMGSKGNGGRHQNFERGKCNFGNWK